jgi:uncharacterized protein YjbI with pentapeptide repeats
MKLFAKRSLSNSGSKSSQRSMQQVSRHFAQPIARQQNLPNELNPLYSRSVRDLTALSLSQQRPKSYSTKSYLTHRLTHIVADRFVLWASFAIASVVGVLAFPQPAAAANSQHVAQLLETGMCQGCDLIGADLTGAHLIGADLRGANLTDAILAQVNLEGADLSRATLVNTDMSGAFLTNAILDNALIRKTNFANSTLIYTSLEGASIDQVNLVGANVLNTPISVGGSYDQ